MPIGVYRRPSAQIRFWSKVQITEGCWLWLGAKHHKGYGSFWTGEKYKEAHRFAYEFAVGAVPEGLQIDHLCRNRGCVKPEHLEAVTQRENLRRGMNYHRSQTHCKRGHPFDLFNTYRATNGRACRICAREHSQRRWRREKEAIGRRTTGKT